MLRKVTIVLITSLPVAGIIFGLVGIGLAGPMRLSLFNYRIAIDPLTYFATILLLSALAATCLLLFILWRTESKTFLDLSHHDQSADGTRTGQVGGDIARDAAEWVRHSVTYPMERLAGQAERIKESGMNYTYEQLRQEMQWLLSGIAQQAANLRITQDNLEDFAKLKASDRPRVRNPVELPALIDEICWRYEQQAKESGKTIESSFVPEAKVFGRIYSDRAAIIHIVNNLVHNAMKYARSKVKISVYLTDHQCFIEVWDDGPGIPKPYLHEQIFQRNWKLSDALPTRDDAAKDGSGWGLYIAKELAHHCNGELTAESDESTFTNFIVELPLSLQTTNVTQTTETRN